MTCLILSRIVNLVNELSISVETNAFEAYLEDRELTRVLSLEEQCYFSIIYTILNQNVDLPKAFIQRHILRRLPAYPSIANGLLTRIGRRCASSLDDHVLLALVHDYTSRLILKLDACRVSPNAISRAIERCHSFLREVKFTGSRFSVRPLLRSLYAHQVALSHLSLDRCAELTDADTVLILMNLRSSLKQLSVLGCSELTNCAFNVRASAPQLIHFPCALTELSLSSPHISDPVVSNIAFIGRQLTSLELPVTLIRPESFLLLAGFPIDSQIARHLEANEYALASRLDTIVLRRSVTVRRQLLLPLSASFCPGAPAPSAVPPTPGPVPSSAPSCAETLTEEVLPIYRPVLRSLSIEFAAVATPQLLLAFRLLMRCCEHLQSLEWNDMLKQTERREDPTSVLPFLCALVQERPQLVSLALQWYQGFAYPLHCLYPLALLKELESLKLYGVHMTDGNIIEAIIRNNPRLVHLSLSSSDISDCAAESISEAVAPQLELLDLSWCDESLTHRGIARLAERCRSLRFLNLRMAFASRFAIIVFVMANPGLEVLLLHGIQRPAARHGEEGTGEGEEEEDEEEEEDGGLVMDEDAEEEGMEAAARSVQKEVVNDAVCRCIAMRLQHVMELDLSFNLAVTNRGIHSILSSCLALEILRLCDCKLLTAKPFLEIIPDFHRLQRSLDALQIAQLFRLRRSRGIDIGDSSDEYDDVLYFPHRSSVFAPQLSFLDLAGCDHVSDKTMEMVVLVCRNSLQVIRYFGDPVVFNLEPQ